jgi:phosphate transport system permease protein
VLPLQAFNWLSQPQSEFRDLAAAAILVLLGLLLVMNAVAIWLRNRYEQKW